MKDGTPLVEVVNQRGIGYSMSIARGAIDIDLFTDLVTQGTEWSRTGDHTRATKALAEAMSLWRGEPLPEVASWGRADETIRRVTLRFEQARFTRMQSEFALGRDDHVITHAPALVDARPTSPELWRMWAISTLHVADASSASAICARGLSELREHGISTRPLEDLQERILRDDPDLRALPLEQGGITVFGEPPQVPTDFVGRQTDLAVLREALTARSAGPAPAAIVLHGASGIGKSALALQHWRDTRDGGDILIWVPAASPVTARASLLRCARDLGVPETVPDDDVMDELWRVLSAGPRWTIVFDDAADAAALTAYWPTAGNGAVIVTTQATRWNTGLATLHILPLDELDACHLLERCTAVDEHHVVNELARRLGGVPIALQAAVASLRAGTDATALLNSLTAAAWESGPAGFLPVWRPAVDDLRTESPAAMALASLLAILDTTPVPVDLVRSRRDLLPGPLADALSTSTGTDEIFAMLGRRFSVTTTPVSISGMHALIKTAITAELRERDEYDAWLRIAVELLESVLTRPDSDRPASDVLYPHALAVAAAARAADAEPAATIRLLLFASDHAAVAGEVVIAAKACTDALVVEERRSGRDSEEVATIQMKLGMHLRDRADLAAAEQMFTRALRIREHHTGPRSAPVSEALAAVGIVLFDHGRFRDARHYLDRAIAVQAGLDEVSPALRRKTLAVYGFVLWRLNELEQAREVAQEAHALAEAEVGDDHPIFAMALDNLGKVELARRDLQRALELNRRALQIRRTKHGTRHPFTALSEYHLARVLRERANADELEEARELCVHALEVYHQRFGADYGHVARCQAELGRVQLALGEHLAAVHTLTEAHGVAMRTLGVEHYETALCLSDLAHAHLAAGQPGHAISCANDAIATLRRGGEFDDQHPYLSGLIRLIEAAHAR
ncbi:hypothetical protein ADL03_15070 [Nocardia sp. NRRL S-836]|nr:hypothetical protein ADL03_15070 [Nocardia sp. NRRL S-836]